MSPIKTNGEVLLDLIIHKPDALNQILVDISR